MWGRLKQGGWTRKGDVATDKGTEDKAKVTQIHSLDDLPSRGLLQKDSTDQTSKQHTREFLVDRESMATLSVKKEDIDPQGEVCFITQSPYRIMKMAARGNLAEVERLYKADKSRVQLTDVKGRTALHHAALSGHEPVVRFLIAKHSDEENVSKQQASKQPASPPGFLRRFTKSKVLKGGTISSLDVQDNEKNTALHLAAEANQAGVLKMLLDAGASSTLLNSQGNTALTTAVKYDQREALATIASHPSVDTNGPCEKGVTGLHIAAFKDHAECARILLDNGARLCQMCEIGMGPVHVATLHGSSKTLDAMIQHAEKSGYTKEHILNLRDASKNMPLHTAVSGGDIRAVRMCLKAGAQISALQDDNSTPIHIAAIQGNDEMIRVMFEAQPENVDVCMKARDTMEMTPLHKAAVFDRSTVAQYLIEQGADVDALDYSGKSPVLLAASKKSWATVEVLLKNKADVTIRDKKNRNILHLVIRNGGKPEDFSFCMCKMKVGELSNAQDEYGCTPLHYASQQGQLKTVESLLRLGAVLNAKNNNREAPLYFAAGHGRINTCRRLLDSPSGKNSINETNGDGATPLHAAAFNGHSKVVYLLLQKGACVLKDRYGNTALHEAAKEGYVQTVQTILNVHAVLLNAKNRVGDTALHLASRHGHASVVTLLLSYGAAFERNLDGEIFVDIAICKEQKDVLAAVVSHDRWDEALRYHSVRFGCPMAGLIKHSPDICQMVLDRCRTSSGHEASCKEFHWVYDFRFLDMDAETVQKFRQEKKEYQPLFAMNTMVAYNRVHCLSHPVCLNFLKMKWRTYGMWFWAIDLMIYIVFLASLTSFITNYHDVRKSNLDGPPHNATNMTSESPTHWSERQFQYQQLPPDKKVTVMIILVFSLLNMMKEIFQMVQQRLKYLTDLNNLLEWVLYITSTIFVIPFLAGKSDIIQWQCGSIAVFLAWFNLLLFLRRFDLYGIYVVMFLEILRTLIQVLLVFSILMIAFGLSFYAIMYTDDTMTFSTPLLSLMTVSLMMLGNIEYIDSWVNPDSDTDPNTLYFATTSFIMLAIFILLMPILLMNLLIGLAVGDIEAVQKDATLKRLAMQVELHTDLEKKLPDRFLKYVHKASWEVYPNRAQYWCTKFFQWISQSREDDYASNNEKSSESIVYRELYTQKKRLKSVQKQLEKQHDLLRLIVQKMEIVSEADDQEEEDSNNTSRYNEVADIDGVGWSNPALRNTLLKQASVLAKWGKSVDQKLDQ